MGADQPIRKDINAMGVEFEPCYSNREDYQRYEADAPYGGYARPAQQRPRLLPEVEDTLRKQRSNFHFSGSSSGNKFPVYELSHSPGVFYEGEWKNGKQNGRGAARGINGTYIEAYFVNGKAEGKGVHVFADGSYYNGEFQYGQFNGKGRFFYKLNGMTYEGQWRDGKPNGKGEQHFPGIGRYRGQFHNGLKHGRGEMKWDDGRQYDGDFYEGYMHGEGVLKLHKGSYKGQFDRNNKVAGPMKTETGKYQGPFYRGQMSGYGTFTWYNGNVYQGEFKYNKMHGNGTMRLKNGQAYSGVWENGINTRINE